MRSLTICKCPHGIWSVSVDADHSGTRLTPSKHCGRWDTVKSWPMTADQLREMANELECQADQLEHETEKA